jgi:hypothetical protein
MADDDIKSRYVNGQANLGGYLAGDYYKADAQVQLLTCDGPAKNASEAKQAVARLAAAIALCDEWWPLLDRQTKLRELINRPFWSKCWLDAELAIRTGKEERRRALEAYVNRAIEIEQVTVPLVENNRELSFLADEAAWRRAEAELLLTGSDASDSAASSRRKNLLQSQARGAKTAYQARWTRFQQGTVDLEMLYEDSNAWRKALAQLAKDRKETMAANRAHLDRMTSIQRLIVEAWRAGRRPDRDADAVAYYVAEAELLLAKSEQP